MSEKLTLTACRLSQKWAEEVIDLHKQFEVELISERGEPEINIENKKFTKIMVEVSNGEMVEIQELPQEQYEGFLELMHRLRTAYMAVQRGGL